MKILLINNHTKFIDKLQQHLKETFDAEVLTVDLSDIGLAKSEGFDLIVLSGGYNIPNAVFGNAILSEEDFVFDERVPIIGICFGFKLLGEMFGSTVVTMPEREHGIIDISVIKDDLIFEGRKSFKVFESHTYAITEVGSSLEALASSQDGVEIFKHRTRPIYAFQFHPEVYVDDNDGYVLLSNAVDIMF